MSKVDVGYLPNQMGNAGANTWRRVAALAEDIGLDHVSCGDHVSFFVGAGFDGLIGSATLLGASETLNVNTAVYLLPLRHPVLVARQLSDLAAIGPGRFTFGVGIGGEDPHEVEICDVDPTTRGRRMDECMTVVRELLSGEPIDFDGDFFSLEQAQIVPAPSEPVPIIVGGRSDAAIDRAGRLGDGWFGVWVSPRRYGEAIEQMQAAAAEAGRSDVSWTNALNVWCGVGANRDEARGFVAPQMEGFYQPPYERFEKWSPAGTPEQLAEFLAPYVDAGCSTFNLIACGESAAAEIEAVAEVRSLLQEAT